MLGPGGLASSRVSNLAADRRPRLTLEIDLPGAVRHDNCFGAIKTRREVAHIDRWEVGRTGASREMPRRGTRREVNRIAARGEVARIAGYRDPIRSPVQQGGRGVGSSRSRTISRTR